MRPLVLFSSLQLLESFKFDMKTANPSQTTDLAQRFKGRCSGKSAVEHFPYQAAQTPHVRGPAKQICKQHCVGNYVINPINTFTAD